MCSYFPEIYGCVREKKKKEANESMLVNLITILSGVKIEISNMRKSLTEHSKPESTDTTDLRKRSESGPEQKVCSDGSFQLSSFPG